MTDDSVLLDRFVPDVVDTTTLSPVLAAEIDHLAGRWERWVAPGSHHPAITARALTDAARHAEARETLAASAPDRTWPVHALTAAVWTASRVGPATIATGAAAVLDGTGDGPFVFDGDVPLGPRALFVALAHAAEGDEAAAAPAFDDAVGAGDRRAPVWGARARSEAARSALGGAEPDPRGDRLAANAGLFFRAGGYRHLAAQLDALVDGDLLPGPDVAAPGHPGTGRLVAAVGDPRRARWCVGYGVAPAAETPGSKGLVVLAHLLSVSRAVPAIELDAVAAGRTAEEVHRRLAAVGTEAELSALVNDDAVRSRVTKLIRRTIARLEQVHPVLARHLGGRVETGYLCRYRGVHTRWRR